jgi:murein DD-endopeptidase MepM/ murein hydrolase activator NlpD
VDAVRRALLVGLLVVAGVPPPASADAGPWGWPLAGSPQVSRPFAPPASAYGAGHRGVDLPSAPGAAVRASAAGRVSYAGLLAGRGVVVVTHGSLRTTYEPVAASVRVGQAVALGEVVGQLEPGHLGCAAVACLHWGLRRGEQYLDPVRLVRRGPVRLLPLGGGAGPRAELIRARPPGVPLAADASDGGGGEQSTTSGSALDPAPEVAEPGWSLRAAEAPLGAAALAALVLGIGLLARPRPGPPDPVSGGAAGAGGLPVVPEELVGPDAQLLDLEQARLRRVAS